MSTNGLSLSFLVVIGDSYLRDIMTYSRVLVLKSQVLSGAPTLQRLANDCRRVVQKQCLTLFKCMFDG